MNTRSTHTSHARTALNILMVVTLAFAVVGCSKKNKGATRVQGDRLSVLSFERELEADATLANAPVTLPRAYTNRNWPQPGGNIANVHHHLSMGEFPTRIWQQSIGRGSGKYERLAAAPVVAEGNIYVVDTRAMVSAFNADTGARLWQVSVAKTKKEERSKAGFGGGVVYSGGNVFVSTGFGTVSALDAATGQELWRRDTGIPIRGAPSASAGRIFVSSFDNQLFALEQESGEILWDYVGIVEDSGVLGASSPAIFGDTVIAGFSSGELLALRAENGQVAWQDALSRTGRLTALASLNDIDGQPVIDRGRVYAVNHAGRMAAIDIRTGERVWETNIGSLYTPWLAGEYLFVVTIDGEIAALSIRDGRVRWVSQLQRFEKPDKRKGVIRWAGPVLAGDRLFVVSSHGYMLTVSPYTGEILSGEKLSDGTVISPIVVNGTLYVLTDDGRLTAYR